MQTSNKIKVALADDHAMFRRGLISILKSHKEICILFDAANGLELFHKVQDAEEKPDVCILDINMPVLHGFDTAKKIKTYFPDVKILALSMYDEEAKVIQMLRCGANGYILKDSEPAELVKAIHTVVQQGFYYSDLITDNVLDRAKQPAVNIELNAQEIAFLRLICSDLTYKEIASEMSVSERTADGYRDKLFGKLDVKSRVGLAIYAISNGLLEKV